jgi:hypothetical protein
MKKGWIYDPGKRKRLVEKERVYGEAAGQDGQEISGKGEAVVLLLLRAAQTPG